MSQIYREYTKARIGWFLFGWTGWQAGVVAVSTLPVFWSLHTQAWSAAALLALVSAAVTIVTVVPVRGRSAIGWLIAAATFTAGGAAGWTRYRSRAATGRAGDLDAVDLPGSLAGIEIHEGPPVGLAGVRVAIIQNHTDRTWTVAATLVHPGVGLCDIGQRARMGQGLADLLDQAARTGLIEEILILVRTVPDDGAERDQWIARHRRDDTPQRVRAVNDDLHRFLTGASVRTEAYLSIVVPESRLAKAAREAGRGLPARAQVMYALMAEVETQLKGALGASSVAWLTSPQLAAATRTGFAPGDRAGIIDALTAHGQNPGVNADVPWALAGPSGADAAVRHYSHDAWNSISATVILPIKGAVLGALAPVLTPSGSGERRSLLVALPILPEQQATRQSATSEWTADMGQALREKAKVKTSTRTRDQAEQVRSLEAKLSRGHALTRPYAIATVTVPKTAQVGEYGRRLDASIRAAGYAPLRLDLAQDAAFAASVLPLGVSPTRGTHT